jgi:hypothetical protein
MLFEKLIEQHRVDRFVANGLWFSGLVASDEGGVNSASSAIAEESACVGSMMFFVAKRDRLQREERFAGVAHRLDFLLIASGGEAS